MHSRVFIKSGNKEKIVHLLNSFRLTSEPIALNLEVLPLQRYLEIEEGSTECIISKYNKHTD